MKLLRDTFLALSILFFTACGENTTKKIIPDIQSIEINSSDISKYATDSTTTLGAYVNYDDGSSTNITNSVVWSSSNTTLTISSSGTLSNIENGGESNITIAYEHLRDTINVKVAKLISINYSDINLSDTSNAQTIYTSGNFDNNETNITMNANIVWITDTNATISDSNASAVTLTLHDTQTLLYATLLDKEFFCHPVTKALLSINYSDVNSSDINKTQIVYISGNYENNESNVTLTHQIHWSSDTNSTIGDTNATQIALTIHNTPTTITGTLFFGTLCAKDFNKSW